MAKEEVLKFPQSTAIVSRGEMHHGVGRGTALACTTRARDAVSSIVERLDEEAPAVSRCIILSCVLYFPPQRTSASGNIPLIPSRHRVPRPFESRCPVVQVTCSIQHQVWFATVVLARIFMAFGFFGKQGLLRREGSFIASHLGRPLYIYSWSVLCRSLLCKLPERKDVAKKLP